MNPNKGLNTLNGLDIKFRMDKITAKWEAGEAPDIVLKVREAQVRQLYGQTWSGLAGVILIMLLDSLALWQVIPHWKILSWSVALVLISAIRGFSIIAFQRKAPSGDRIYWWARVHVAGDVASGVMWALPPLFLWPGDSPVHQMIWPVCIVALTASAVAKYCIWPPAYIPYLMVTAMPISLRLLLESGFTYTLLGVLGLVFTAILAQTGKLMHDASLSALIMGIRNEALSAILIEEKSKEKELNAQLQQEIKDRTRSQEELRLRNQELERLNTQLTTTKETLESTNRELEQALSDVRQLSGMLPICSSCKKIRNDSGYWQQIEAYFKDHSQVEFSHSICPDCAAKLYPDYFNKIKPK